MFLSKNNPQSPPLKYGAISKKDLLNMGASHVAYIKEMHAEDKTIFRVYLADGTLISEEEDYNLAYQDLREHNMICATVH